MNILVIDVGTSSMRGVLFNSKGEILFQSRRKTPPTFISDVLVEQNPSDWTEGTLALCRETAGFASVHGLSVDAIALTSQRSSIIPVDQNGKPLRPAIMWQDKRNLRIVEELQPHRTLVYQKTGSLINTVFSGTKMTWFRRNEPELYEKTYKLCTIADLIVFHLTGDYRTDTTYGSRSLLMDLKTGSWDSQLLQLFEVDPGKLCDIVPAGSIIGHVQPSFARKSGLHTGIPVISAGGDQQCAALGQGVYEKGSFEMTSGTGAFMIAVSDEIPQDLSLDVVCNAHAVPGKFILECSMLTCSALYDWVVRTFFEQMDYRTVNRLIARTPAGANGVRCLPFFQGRGTPDWNPAAKGAFLNLTLSTTKEDLARSALEALAAEAGNHLALLEKYAGPANTIFIGGGLTASDSFCQMEADLWGHEVLLEKEQTEHTAYGAWLNSMRALGEEIPHRKTSQYIHFYPDPAHALQYQSLRRELSDTYQKLYT